MRNASKAAALTAIVWALGVPALHCASRRTETVTTRVFTMTPTSEWAGKTQSEIVASWGKPNRTEPDGLGGTILYYEEREEVDDPVDPNRARVEAAVRTQSSDEDRHIARVPGTEFVRKDYARFYLDEGGRVTRAWLSDHAWKNGPLKNRVSKRP